jgi:hypothetical protein
MKEPLNVQNVRSSQLLWRAVAIVFVAFECFVIYSHSRGRSFSFSSWLFYEPVIGSPLTNRRRSVSAPKMQSG